MASRGPSANTEPRPCHASRTSLWFNLMPKSDLLKLSGLARGGSGDLRYLPLPPSPPSLWVFFFSDDSVEILNLGTISCLGTVRDLDQSPLSECLVDARCMFFRNLKPKAELELATRAKPHQAPKVGIDEGVVIIAGFLIILFF